LAREHGKMNSGVLITAPAWAWAIPIIVGLFGLLGVAWTVIMTQRNMRRQLQSSHTLKIAEMRQAWINDLRNTMATFQSYGVTPNLDQKTCREFYETGTKIELMMNPTDPDYAELQRCLYRFLDSDGPREKYSSNPDFIDVGQRILKREWEVLKRDIQGASQFGTGDRSPSKISN
jgi:hypothetical protein